MTGVLGKWSWLAETAIDMGLPPLGMAFGIPGPVSTFAIKKLKKLLGLKADATPDDVSAAIAADPDAAKVAFEQTQSATTAKYAYLTRLAEVRGEVDKANIAEVNTTIRNEVAAGVSWWHWRHLLGYLVLLYGLVQVACIAYAMLGKGMKPSDLAEVFNSTAWFTAGLFGLLGFVASDTSSLKQTAMTGTRPEGVIASAVRVVTGKKK